MKQSKFSESQRMAIVAKQEAGESVEDICRAHSRYTLLSGFRFAQQSSYFLQMETGHSH